MATATEEKLMKDVTPSVLSRSEAVPPTFLDDTVWIGFMDIVPVIGTVKEAVELVLAVYEGNEAVIKEKEEALENIVKESLNKDMKKLTLHDKTAADADEFSGLRNVREVSMGMIIEYVMKGSKRGPKPLTSAEQKAREKIVEKIKKDMLRKIHIIDPKFSQELKEELGRSKRGEHVFNNNILKFHYKVPINFIQSHHITNLRGYNQQAMDALGSHTLPQNTETDIRTKMVVDFGEHEFYVNANAVLYGVYCSALRKAMLDVLNHINPDDVTEAERESVNFVIDNMNKHEIYVDHMAKDKWITSQRNPRQVQIAQARFEEVRGEVVHMYNTDRGVDWCIDILTEVAPLFVFKHRQ